MTMANDDVLIRKAHEAAREATERGGGLHAEKWKAIRDGAACLRRQLKNSKREPTPVEAWILDCGTRATRWLGPSPLDFPEEETTQ